MKKTQRSFNSTLRSSSLSGRGRRKRKVSMAPFRQAVGERDQRCVLCPDYMATRHWFDCHHLIPKQRLDDEAALDGRNGVLLCRRHHDLIEGRRLTIPLERLPEGFAQFLADHPEAGDPVGVSKADLAVLRDREAA